MTPEEYIQLKAFARVDGALLFLLWIGCFLLYIYGMEIPTMGMLSMLLLMMSPFYAAMRLRKFRDQARGGSITFARGYAYIILTFFYSGLLFALAQYAYFTYMDHGFLLAKFTEIASMPETVQLGVRDIMQQGVNEMAAMRPIDFSLNVLTIIIVAGFLMGMPIAAVTQKRTTDNSISKSKIENQ